MEKKLASFQNRCSCRLLSIKWNEFITNEEVLKMQMHSQSNQQYCQELGHVLSGDKTTKAGLVLETTWKRKRGLQNKKRTNETSQHRKRPRKEKTGPTKNGCRYKWMASIVLWIMWLTAQDWVRKYVNCMAAQTKNIYIGKRLTG